MANPDVNPTTFHGTDNPNADGVHFKFYCMANATSPEMTTDGYQNFNIKYTASNSTEETWVFDNADIGADRNQTKNFLLWFAAGFFG